MRKVAFFVAFLLCFSSFLTVYAEGETKPLYDSGISFTAEAIYMEHLNTGTVVMEKNADQRMYPVAMVKIMTVMLVLENVTNLDEMVTAEYSDFNGMDPYGTTAGIKAGETMSVRDLLYCAVVASANEACNILARHVAGSVDAFVRMMNDRARELGCTGTNFTNTHGLHDENNYSTARDLALICKAALNQPVFVEMSKLTRYTLPATNMSEERLLVTSNYIIDPTRSQYYYQYAQGLRSGYTSAAGCCVASYATKDNTSYLCVMLGSPRGEDKVNNAMLDAKKAFTWAFNSLSMQPLFETTTKRAEVAVELAWGRDYVSLAPEATVEALLPEEYDPSLFTEEITTVESTETPVRKGEVLGTMRVTYTDPTTGATRVMGEVNLIAQDDIERSQALYILSRVESFVKSIWFRIIAAALIVVFILYLILVFVVNKKRNRRANAYKRGVTVKRRGRGRGRRFR